MNGTKSYLFRYGAIVTLSVPTGRPITRSLEVDPRRFLYEGARGGPVNVTLPIGEGDVGHLAPGRNTNATVTVRFVGDVQYLNGAQFQDSAEREVGNLMIVNGVEVDRPILPGNVISYIVLAALVVLGFFILRRTLTKLHVQPKFVAEPSS